MEKKEDENDITTMFYRKLVELNKDGELDKKLEQERLENEKQIIKRRNERGLSDWGPYYSILNDGRYQLNYTQLLEYENLKDNLLKDKPIIYDEQQLWWIWNSKSYRWEIADETRILVEFDNIIKLTNKQSSINTFTKNTILEALKRAGRNYYNSDIKPISKTMVVFKDCIIDVNTGISYKNTPDFFSTNVIPYTIWNSTSIETPNMDRLISEWVGEKYVDTMYEIIAYCILTDYPIHRLFCFIGAGRNGKSTFIRLLLKFIGFENSTSVELETLTNNPFTSSKLYKKLVCLVGETNFNVLRNTETIKKLTGQDMIAAQFKHRPLFDFQNYAKIIIATNSLPQSLDKTWGFYSRWQIVDFPNRFSEAKDVLAEIPEEEYENLARKSIIILKKLLKNRKFTNEGSLEQRMELYEEKSNPLQKFIKDNYDFDQTEKVIGFEFYDDFCCFLKKNNYRVWSRKMVSKSLKEYGIEAVKEWVEFNEKANQWVVYYGIKPKVKDADVCNNGGVLKYGN